MSTFLTVVIVVSALFIVFAVIMQPSKDGGLGGLASGGVTDSVFGTNRNEFLAKTTWWLMAIFLISSIVLAKHRTTEHEEREAEINTRTKLEELNDAKPIKTVIEDAEKKADDAKTDIQKKIDEATNDAEKKADDAKTEVKDALDKTLPKAE